MVNLVDTDKLLENKTVQALMIAACIGLLSWNVYTTQRLSIDVAVLANVMESSNISVVGTQVALQDQRIARLEDWTSRLSVRIADIESDIRREDASDQAQRN